MIIGITGSSGSGKSFVCEKISRMYNAEIIDADIVAKELQDNKTEYYYKIIETFGKDILLDTGKIDRKKLANIIFSSKAEKEKLDKLTFKYVVDEIKNRIEELKQKNLDYIIVDAPTLIEANMNYIFDKIIVVVAEEKNKVTKICERDGISEEFALKRLKSQKTDEFYKEYADFIIENNYNNLDEQIDDIIKKLERNNF